ncbi:ABC transporter ATP-binding protein [Deinococcus murrayi]|uniref:ABC transporter ATP-binding protein n=1 Tax=Deinococcus murrayi TaxID=68910 RepID=UPI00068625B7|nr:ABC transporter ATP-binding protein [Deinococcus murrayi]
MLELRDAHYAYQLGSRPLNILQGCSWSFLPGSFTAVRAPSGAGKTTLLNILGLMDRLTAGSYRINGEEVSSLSDERQSLIRARSIGFLFQNFRLVPDLDVRANVVLALEIAGVPQHERRARAEAALEQVGLQDRLTHLPPELSGGEAQRVALARALVKTPQVLLADEPTGNLDPVNRERILHLVSAYHAGGGTVVMVTHDAQAAAAAEQVVELRDGRLRGAASSPGCLPG